MVESEKRGSRQTFVRETTTRTPIKEMGRMNSTLEKLFILLWKMPMVLLINLPLISLVTPAVHTIFWYQRSKRNMTLLWEIWISNRFSLEKHGAGKQKVNIWTAGSNYTDQYPAIVHLPAAAFWRNKNHFGYYMDIRQAGCRSRYLHEYASCGYELILEWRKNKKEEWDILQSKNKLKPQRP